MRRMAKDGRLCKPRVRDWPSFLRRWLPPEFWQSFLGCVARSGDPRTRWVPKYVVLCWIFTGWSSGAAILDRFAAARDRLAALFPSRRRPGGSYQGLVKATLKLGHGVLHDWWKHLRPMLSRRLGAAWNWHGWIVFAVDGSRVDAPRTKANLHKLGRAGRVKTHPQWWVTALVHLPSRLIWDWRQDKGTASERGHLREMIPSLPGGSLLLADAGFVGFKLLRHLEQSGVDFIIRCGANVTLLIQDAAQRIERIGTQRIVYLWPSRHASQTPLKLRLIVLRRRGKRVYLLTNVLESERLSRHTAGELYAARWGVELNYRSLKQTLGRRKVLARTPQCGGCELAGNILALALLLACGAWVLRAQAQRLSVAALLRILRRAGDALLNGRPSGWFLDAARAAVLDSYQRRRSKRARDWPHKKHEWPASAPILRRPTKHQLSVIRAITC